RLLVIAPPVRPSLPVAFDTGGVRKKTQSGWARWDGAENLAALEKEITGKLAERAGHPATLDKIRDESRVAVARFVRNWLLGKEAWAEGRLRGIVVVFAGGADKSILCEPATLRLGDGLGGFNVPNQRPCISETGSAVSTERKNCPEASRRSHRASDGE